MPPVIFLLLRRLRQPLILLISVYAVATLGLTLIPGVGPDGQPWRMGFFHAFYFVSFMGSTIGFGELPYPFTDTQRIWVLASIYTSVVVWLYTIGSMLGLIQDPAFRHAVTTQRFRRQIKNLSSPFWMICGYGDTGALVCEQLTERQLHVVVVDPDQEALNQLQLVDFRYLVPGLQADARDPDNLVAAGITHPLCEGVIALTRDDHTNLKIAVSTKLLSPHLPVICRSEFHDAADNMRSFGTDLIINPFDIFARHLSLALQHPQVYVILRWLTGRKGVPLPEPADPPHGRWVLCGFGRFGKALTEYLGHEGIEFTIVDSDPALTEAPEGTILGRGTEAATLRQAGIESARGLVAATDDDANNLSIIITAKQLNPSLFTVARQNDQKNSGLFAAAKLDLVMRRSEIVSNMILVRITRPLVTRFLNEAVDLPEEVSTDLVRRIRGLTDGRGPATWRFTVSWKRAPAVMRLLEAGAEVRIDHFCREPESGRRLRCIPLLMIENGSSIILPSPERSLKPGDRIMFCGHDDVAARTEWMIQNVELLERSIGMARHDIPLLNWWARRTKKKTADAGIIQS